jgi:hypothetical protein
MPVGLCIQDNCNQQATVCQECMRALALMWWGGIARHPEAGTDCRLCEEGLACYCGEHLVSQVVEYRRGLRGVGTPLGEPLALTGATISETPGDDILGASS